MLVLCQKSSSFHHLEIAPGPQQHLVQLGELLQGVVQIWVFSIQSFYYILDISNIGHFSYLIFNIWASCHNPQLYLRVSLAWAMRRSKYLISSFALLHNRIVIFYIIIVDMASGHKWSTMDSNVKILIWDCQGLWVEKLRNSTHSQKLVLDHEWAWEKRRRRLFTLKQQDTNLIYCGEFSCWNWISRTM